MPKAKIVHKSFKLTPHKHNGKMSYIALALLAGFMLVGGYFYSKMERTSINEIREGEAVVSVFPPRQIPETPVQRDCEAIKTLSISDNCAVDSYKKAIYTCGSINRKKPNLQVISGACKSYKEMYQEAASTCLKNCLDSTPAPTATATPKATPTPSCMPQKPCPVGVKCLQNLDRRYCQTTDR